MTRKIEVDFHYISMVLVINWSRVLYLSTCLIIETVFSQKYLLDNRTPSNHNVFLFQNPTASTPQLWQVQVGGGGRERAGAGADPRRDAAHAAVQVHAALGAGQRRGGARAAAPRARAAAARQARARQLTRQPRAAAACPPRQPRARTPPPRHRAQALRPARTSARLGQAEGRSSRATTPAATVTTCSAFLPIIFGKKSTGRKWYIGWIVLQRRLTTKTTSFLE